ncbi:MAG: hypothetical protein ACRD22_04435 [Terriglobia bacterium]
MNRRLIYRSGSILVLVLITSSVWSGARAAKLTNENAPARYASYISMIESAIKDEMVVATSVEVARKYGVESKGRVPLNLNVLVAPFTPNPNGFSTHVIYLIPGYGYVIRVVSVYPKEKLAMFWLGYSTQGPGLDTGINCTHSHSNCKIEDIPFGDLRTAFCSWWLTTLRVNIGNSSVIRGAKQRNAEREKLRYQIMNEQ